MTRWISTISCAALALSAGLALTGCAGDAKPFTATVRPASGNLARLMAMPDAQQARTVAPIFTRDALETVADLEEEIKELKIRPATP